MTEHDDNGFLWLTCQKPTRTINAIFHHMKTVHKEIWSTEDFDLTKLISPCDIAKVGIKKGRL